MYHTSNKVSSIMLLVVNIVQRNEIIEGLIVYNFSGQFLQKSSLFIGSSITDLIASKTTK